MPYIYMYICMHTYTYISIYINLSLYIYTHGRPHGKPFTSNAGYICACKWVNPIRKAN